ncbi:MAG: hypothetical protein FWH21_07990 [Kiritimatiellaeota bacterium]|nr:hypothetical protein [Kiritimatiellota bacterium]
MKKLMMFAAAMTIVGGAFAQCTPTQLDCALVYNVKLNLKTSMGKVAGGSLASLCSPTVTTVACIRYPNYSYVIDGYIAICECECDSLADNAEVFSWNTKLRSIDPISVWEFDTLHVIGNQTQAETTWGMTGTDEIIGDFSLTGAGFGKFKKSGVQYFTSFSGYAAGQLDQPVCLINDNCDPAGYWYCDDLTANGFDDSEEAPLFGTWAIKFNAAASKRYAIDAYLKVPSFYGFNF